MPNRAQLPQDVEEFIAENEYDESSPTEIEGFKVIPSRDVRAWMSGHVRVPVEPTQRMMKAAFECGPYPDLRVMWDAALNASKESE